MKTTSKKKTRGPMERTRPATQREKSLCILGLELGGGKSGRTSLVVLEYFPQQKKIFVRDHIPHVTASNTRFGDEVLLDHLRKIKPDHIAVNAPLTMPPCLKCSVNDCAGYRDCKNPPVYWMHQEALRAKIPALKHPTPYTQRPLDVYLRTRVQNRYLFDLFLEESLGSGRAPLALRMRYVRSQISKTIKILETNPRVALVGTAEWFGITARELRRYREPEDGVAYRQDILEKLQADLSGSGLPQLFLYNSESTALASELPCFQALFSALMAVYGLAGFLQKPDPDFDIRWGWMALPANLG